MPCMPCSLGHTPTHPRRCCQCAQALGALKPPKSVLRSHVVVAKGGKLLDVRNGVSPGDSFAQAAAFCAQNKQA